MISRETRILTKEALIYLYRQRPECFDWPIYYIGYDPHLMDVVTESVVALQHLPKIPWPDDKCVVISENLFEAHYFDKEKIQVTIYDKTSDTIPIPQSISSYVNPQYAISQFGVQRGKKNSISIKPLRNWHLIKSNLAAAAERNGILDQVARKCKIKMRDQFGTIISKCEKYFDRIEQFLTQHLGEDFWDFSPEGIPELDVSRMKRHHYVALGVATLLNEYKKHGLRLGCSDSDRLKQQVRINDSLKQQLAQHWSENIRNINQDIIDVAGANHDPDDLDEFVEEYAESYLQYSNLIMPNGTTEFWSLFPFDDEIAKILQEQIEEAFSRGRRLKQDRFEALGILRFHYRQFDFLNAAHVLANLANIVMPCGYLVETRFDSFGPKRFQDIIPQKPIFSYIDFNRVYHEYQGEAEGSHKQPHHRRGHVRYLWKKAGIDRLSLPESAVERMRVAQRCKVERVAVSPAWIGPKNLILDGIRYDLKTGERELMPL